MISGYLFLITPFPNRNYSNIKSCNLPLNDNAQGNRLLLYTLSCILLPQELCLLCLVVHSEIIHYW